MAARRDDLPPLLERADELGLLLALLDRRASRVVLVRGEAGIGKTALLLHLARSVEGRNGSVSWNACSPLRVARPPGTLVDMLAGDGARPRLSLLVVEDLQWADEATLEALRLLARPRAGQGALV